MKIEVNNNHHNYKLVMNLDEIEELTTHLEDNINQIEYDNSYLGKIGRQLIKFRETGDY